MVRSVIVKGKEYYVVTTSMNIGGIEAPVQVHINVSHLSEEDRYKVQKHANYYFNRVFKAIPKSEPKIRKPWYKFW